ncbi:MAG: hypothetical protein LBE04_00735 [Prevotellaceae bacterium]|jgi:hypothetical protein|nr:hypothetical protein [Prevotellaceae bacterium]
MNKKSMFTFFLTLGFAFTMQAQVGKSYGFGQRPENLRSLAQQFAAPADDYKPHAWWHWLGTNYSKEGMTLDLQAMKEAGIGGVVVFNAPSWLDPAKNPWQHQTYRSVTYWDALQHALAEAKRLNMTVGIHNTPGWSTTGGPWVLPEDGMQAVAYSKTPVKSGAKVKTALPNPCEDAKTAQYFKDVAVIAVPANKDIATDEIIDISQHMDANGVLEWQAPAGEWTIYRVGHFPTMTHSHPTPDDVAEYALEADKMNPTATVKHWNNVLNPFIDRFGDYIGTTFKYIWIDSYEAGDQNWSPNFRAEFIRIKGYDPVFQLVMADVRGDNIISPKYYGLHYPENAAPETRRFLRDHAEVVNRLFLDCFRIGKEMVNKTGFTLCWEPYCSWGEGPFDMREGVSIADIPVTEFWIHSGDILGNETLAKASSASKKRIIGAEAFTGMEATCKYTETPQMLKHPADMGYSYGVNMYFLHSWAHNPFPDKYQPGFSFAHYGTHFSRNQTWFEPGKAFFTYLARCQMLLQQGSFVSLNGEVLRRSTPEAEIFFVRNTGGAQLKVLEFPVTDRVPELWDAYEGVIKSAEQWSQNDNKTTISLAMGEDASIFVIFPAHKTSYAKLPVRKETKATVDILGGKWTVLFKPKTGEEPFSRTFSSLVDFSKQDDDDVKYFSGTAVYETTIQMKSSDLSANRAVTLNIDELYDIAEIEVNGKKAGVLWHPPYRADITAYLKSGANTLKIHVTNTWINRLIGDEQYPEDFEWTDKNQGLRAMTGLPEWFVKNEQRPVKERKTFIPWYYYNKDSPLQPAGLIGPVTLRRQEF